MKTFTEIPRFKLALQNILTRAEEIEHVLAYDSEVRGQGYAAEPDRVLILTHSRGYLLLDRKDIKTMIQELQHIEREMWTRR